MKNKKLAIILVLLLALISGAGFAVYAYQNLCHTKIAFAGGSITFQGEGKEGYIGIVRYDFYKKGRGDIKTLYFGVNGEMSTDLLLGIGGILALKPDVAVVFVGANDALHYYRKDLQGNPIEKYGATLREIIRTFRKNGVQVIVCSPMIAGERDYSRPADTARDIGTKFLLQPWIDNFDPAKADAEVGLYAERAKQVAREEVVAYCDLRKAFKNYLATHNPENSLEGILTYDGTHPNKLGHQLIAETLLPVLRSNERVKKEPLFRKIFRPFANKQNSVLWQLVRHFDKRIR